MTKQDFITNYCFVWGPRGFDPPTVTEILQNRKARLDFARISEWTEIPHEQTT